MIIIWFDFFFELHMCNKEKQGTKGVYKFGQYGQTYWLIK